MSLPHSLTLMLTIQSYTERFPMDESAPMATATAAAGCNSGGSNYDCGNCHCGDGNCGDGNCDSGGCDSGGCDSGVSDSNYGNGITAGAIIQLKKALYGLNQAPRLWYKDRRLPTFTRLHSIKRGPQPVHIRSRPLTSAAIICRRYLTSLCKLSNQGGR